MKREIGPARWETLAAEPDFRALLRSRRRFVIPATFFFIVYYLALPLTVALRPQMMGRPLVGPLTIAFCFALSQFAMAWILLALYLRRSRAFDLAAARLRRREMHEVWDESR